MPFCDRPKPPLPQPLRGIESGSFAEDTILVRMPDIARRLLAENNLPPNSEANIKALIEEMPNGPIRPLTDLAAPDAAEWREYVAPYEGQDWLEVPWFFAETYFYRRILEATGYFQAGAGRGADPFAHQKRLALETTLGAIRELSGQLESWFKTANRGRKDRAYQGLVHLLAVALWGNQADLSLWPADEDGQPNHEDEAQRQAHTLVDDSSVVAAYLIEREPRVERIDFLVDNAGLELVSDLELATFLLRYGLAKTVYLQLKAQPTFVSDATIRDVRETVTFLAADAFDGLASLGRRVLDYLGDGRLRLRDNLFWTSSLAAWEMPESVSRDLARSSLIISKGDANYRRLLGDLHWPYTTAFSDIVCYSPASLLALRTMKSDVASGLEIDQVARAAELDPDWLVSGRWGVIQFFNKEDEQ